MAQSGLNRLRHSEAANGLLLVSPTAIYAILLLAGPLLTIFAYSFFKDGYLTVIREFTFGNYLATWKDPIFRAILLRSLDVAASAMAGLS